MKIINDCSIFNAEGIEKIEKLRDATYVMEGPVRDKNGNWSEPSVAVFYQKEAHPRGSNYFGLYYKPFSGELMITDALSAVQGEIDAVMAANGDIIYSRYRHDMRYSPDGSVFIDGGRDYCRMGGDLSRAKRVQLRVNVDRLEVVPTLPIWLEQGKQTLENG